MPKLILNAPTDYVIHLLGAWLTLYHVSRMEVAMCSAENRVCMGPIYEYLSVENYAMEEDDCMELQIDWLLVRKIRLHTFRIEYPLPRRAFPKVAAILEQSQNRLQCLDVNDNDSLLNAVGATVSRHCSKLAVLKLDSMTLSAPFFAMFACLHHLQELSFSHCEDLDVELLCGLCFPTVATLTLNGIYSIFAQKAMLMMCPKLVNYHLHNTLDVDLNDIPSTVQFLSGRYCRLVRIGNLKANLTKLSLFACPVTDDVMTRIVPPWSHLQDFDLFGSTLLTDAAVMMIGDKCGHSLQRLSIYKCALITEGGMNYLLKRCRSLTNLKLGGCDHSGSSYIGTVLDKNPHLQALDVRMARMTDEVLAKVAAAHLESLVLFLVTGYTEKGVLALMDGCASLKHFGVEEALVNPVVRLLWKRMRPELQIEIL